MIFPIGVFIQKRKPRYYREQTKSATEIVEVECNVIVEVSFLDKHHTSERYGFNVQVVLSNDEYCEHKKDLKEYVCGRAREQDDYIAMLNNCVHKCANGRKYEVKEHLLLNDPTSVNVKSVRHEWKENLPVY